MSRYYSLHEVIKRDLLDEFKAMLVKDRRLEKSYDFLYVVLGDAVDESAVEILGFLLQEKGLSANARNYQKKSYFIQSVVNHHFDVAHKFLDCKKFNVNISNDDGTTALMSAIATNNNQLVQRLVDYDLLQINAQDHKGNTALIRAVANRKISADIVKQLLCHKSIDGNIANNDGKTALELAVVSNSDLKISALLADERITRDANADFVKECFHKAFFSCNIDVIKVMLKYFRLRFSGKILMPQNKRYQILIDKLNKAADAETLFALLGAVTKKSKDDSQNYALFLQDFFYAWHSNSFEKAKSQVIVVCKIKRIDMDWLL